MAKLTPQEAKSFDTYSLQNAMTVEEAFEECGCVAYEDVFTYNRWAAQGFQVKRGEHGTRITVFIPVKDRESDKVKGRRPKTSVVFCRHQVEEIR